MLRKNKGSSLTKANVPSYLSAPLDADFSPIPSTQQQTASLTPVAQQILNSAYATTEKDALELQKASEAQLLEIKAAAAFAEKERSRLNGEEEKKKSPEYVG